MRVLLAVTCVCLFGWPAFAGVTGASENLAAGEDLAALGVEAQSTASDSLVLALQTESGQPTAQRDVIELPAGTVVRVRMIDSIRSSSSVLGERFRATLDEPIELDGKEIVPRGAESIVEVTAVDKGGVLLGQTTLSLRLASVSVDSRTIEFNTNHANVKSKTQETFRVTAIATGLGAAVGAAIGGRKGAAIGAGAGAGAGAVVAAIRGKKSGVPSETQLEFELREAVRI